MSNTKTASACRNPNMMMLITTLKTMMMTMTQPMTTMTLCCSSAYHNAISLTNGQYKSGHSNDQSNLAVSCFLLFCTGAYLPLNGSLADSSLERLPVKVDQIKRLGHESILSPKLLLRPAYTAKINPPNCHESPNKGEDAL